jgi:hypothetical protein
MSQLHGGCDAFPDASGDRCEGPVWCCWCAAKCAIKCAVLLCTDSRPRPRQHWGFGRFPSPTTRPPRVDVRGRVRVVGLGAAGISELAGAGPATAKEHRTKARIKKQKPESQRQNFKVKNVNGKRHVRVREAGNGCEADAFVAGMKRMTRNMSIWGPGRWRWDGGKGRCTRTRRGCSRAAGRRRAR